MKLHRNLATGVVYALDQIFYQHHYADRVIERLLKSNPSWGSRDRAFLAETVYDIVRWWHLLWTVLDKQANPQQLWDVLGCWWVLKGETLPPWAEFDNLPTEEMLKREKQVKQNRAVRESIPDWLDAIGAQELGEQWEATLQALNQSAPVVIRTNTLKIKPFELSTILQQSYIETTPISETGLVLKQRQNIFKHPAFKEGLFEIQDAASQQVAQALDVQPSQRVVDACAGAGGKTLHLAALMQNKGKIIALDTEAWKLEELRKRARRAGAQIIETRVIENHKIIKRLYDSADRVLLDVPCSGLGVLRRNPDTKWKLSAEQLADVRAKQQVLLQDYSKICKVGGKLVYATCSILPSENQQQVATFLAEKGENFKLLNEQVLLPQTFGFDGFYIAVLERVA